MVDLYRSYICYINYRRGYFIYDIYIWTGDTKMEVERCGDWVRDIESQRQKDTEVEVYTEILLEIADTS